MKFKELKNQIKEQQKELASHIRNQKAKRKKRPNGYISGLSYKRSEFRHRHIAYCQFFNKTPYEKIENKCNESPNTFIIDKYMKEWYNEIDHEDVRDCA